MTISLSQSDARKIVLNSQRLHSRRSFGRGAEASLKAIEHLSYVQIDTLSVVARAHLHTLWNRVESFSPDHIDQLQRAGQVFEYWSHALSILPMKDYRFALPMMERIASGETHWYPKNPKETTKILKRIREEGPLLAKDFSDKKKSQAMWSRSPSKIALEQLFMEGELMTARRINFHKVYDLRERVLPSGCDTRTPNEDELCRHLVRAYLRAHSIGQATEVSYLRKGLGLAMKKVIQEMEEEGEIQTLTVAGEPYFCLAKELERLGKIGGTSSSPKKLRILSPFDNSVIQRKRVSKLFDYDYQVECYVTKAKRRYGYFCLPILSNNQLLGRLDAKASRKDGVFHILHLHLEKPVKNSAAFYSALEKELKRFAAFDGCDQISLHKVSGADVLPEWGQA